mgnify:CR=1 FL=1
MAKNTGRDLKQTTEEKGVKQKRRKNILFIFILRIVCHAFDSILTPIHAVRSCVQMILLNESLLYRQEPHTADEEPLRCDTDN